MNKQNRTDTDRKKQPLELKDLKIQSFITALDDTEKQRIRGGHFDCVPYNTSTGP